MSPGSALGGVHWGMTLVGDVLIVPIADPAFINDANPGVFGLDIKSGELLWSHKASRACQMSALGGRFNRGGTPWPRMSLALRLSAAPVATNDVAFAGSLDGRVMAFEAHTGKVLWEFDTKQEFTGTNGTAAHGGAIDNPGIVVAGDQIMVLSGYDMFGQMPGNVLLMFELATAEAAESG